MNCHFPPRAGASNDLGLHRLIPSLPPLVLPGKPIWKSVPEQFGAGLPRLIRACRRTLPWRRYTSLFWGLFLVSSPSPAPPSPAQLRPAPPCSALLRLAPPRPAPPRRGPARQRLCHPPSTPPSAVAGTTRVGGRAQPPPLRLPCLLPCPPPPSSPNAAAAPPLAAVSGGTHVLRHLPPRWCCCLPALCNRPA